MGIIRYILGLYGIMEKKMETIGIIGLHRDYKVYLGVIWDNGKGNGNYYLRFGV